MSPKRPDALVPSLTERRTLQGSAALAPILPTVRVDAVQKDLPLTHYLWLLRVHGWKIACFAVLATVFAAMVAVRLTPVYESTATLYIDSGAAKNLVGQDAQSATVTPLGETETFVASQIRLMQSDAVVRPLAEKYNLLELEGQVRPGRMPAERIAKIKSAPIVLKGLRITRFPNTNVLQIGYRSKDPNLAAEVANGIARSYIYNTYDIRIRSSQDLSRFMSKQLQELRAKTEASSAKLMQFERELNVINPEEKTNILAARLLQLNSEYTKVQAERVKAEAIYNSLSAGSLEAALSAAQNEDLRDAVKKLNEARSKFADTRSRFGKNHPDYARDEADVKEFERQLDAAVALHAKEAGVEYRRAQNQESLLEKDLAETKQESDRLNARYFEYQRAKQEADTDRALYEELVKRIRQDEINSGFQNNMARIADEARPASRPFYPNVPLIVALAAIGSLAIGAFAIVLSDRIDTTIRNPDQVTKSLQARFLGMLPIVPKGDLNKGLLGLVTEGEKAIGSPDAEGSVRRHSPFDESVRTIRNSILLTDFESRLRSFLVTSATPSEGKSTLASHLAIAHAEQKHKTLLIDADMRRPSVHRVLRVANSDGLSKVLDNELSWQDALIQPRPDLELYVIPAGSSGRRSADQAGQRLPHLLEQAAEQFDLIVVDAPPLLGFPEPLQMAAAVDGVIVVARAGKTDRGAVAAVLNTLNQLRANVIGVILNEVKREMGHSHYYYEAYGKYYAAPPER